MSLLKEEQDVTRVAPQSTNYLLSFCSYSTSSYLSVILFFVCVFFFLSYFFKIGYLIYWNSKAKGINVIYKFLVTSL